jgi:hypothetical protein
MTLVTPAQFGGRMFRVVRNIVFGDVRSTLTSQATRSTSGENSSRSMHHMIIEPDTPIANQLFWVQTIIPSSQGGQHKGGQHKRPAIQHWTRISGDEMLAWIDLPWSTGERSNRSSASHLLAARSSHFSYWSTVATAGPLFSPDLWAPQVCGLWQGLRCPR